MTLTEMALDIDEWIDEPEDDSWLTGGKHQLLRACTEARRHAITERPIRGSRRDVHGFTLSDLVVLLDELPKVDADFLNEVESANLNQPKLSSVKWGP